MQRSAVLRVPHRVQPVPGFSAPSRPLRPARAAALQALGLIPYHHKREDSETRLHISAEAAQQGLCTSGTPWLAWLRDGNLAFFGRGFFFPSRNVRLREVGTNGTRAPHLHLTLTPGLMPFPANHFIAAHQRSSLSRFLFSFLRVLLLDLLAIAVLLLDYLPPTLEHHELEGRCCDAPTRLLATWAQAAPVR